MDPDCTLHTIAELSSFRKTAVSAGMSDADIQRLVDFLAENPNAGIEIVGTGGCRKIRHSIEGNNKGKSGGVRVVTLFTGKDLPVFLITVFAKGKRINLSKKERNQLKVMTKQIVDAYQSRVTSLASGGERA